MLASLAANKIDHGSDNVRSELVEPQELKFQLDATSKKYIAEAEQHFDELVGQHDMHVRSQSSVRRLRVEHDV